MLNFRFPKDDFVFVYVQIGGQAGNTASTRGLLIVAVLWMSHRLSSANRCAQFGDHGDDTRSRIESERTLLLHSSRLLGCNCLFGGMGGG